MLPVGNHNQGKAWVKPSALAAVSPEPDSFPLPGYQGKVEHVQRRSVCAIASTAAAESTVLPSITTQTWARQHASAAATVGSSSRPVR